MMYLVRLIHQRSEDVLRYLEANGLNPYFGEKGTVFEKDIAGQKYNVSIILSNDIVTAVIIDCPKLKDVDAESYKNQITEVKKCLETIYGLPYMDNTNHMCESIWISYEKEDVVVNISGENGMNDEEAYSLNVFVGEKRDVNPKASWWLLVLFMAPGLIYVIVVMLLTMSFGKYDINSFLTYMIGGTVVALLIGMVGPVAFRIAGQNRKSSIRQENDEKFIKYQQENGYEHAMPLTMYPNGNRARLYIKGQEMIVCYESFFGLKRLHVDLDGIKDGLWWDMLSVNNRKKIHYFRIHDTEDIATLVTLVEDAFYQDEAYRTLCTVIENAFKSYNPYSRLNQSEKAFAYGSFYVSRQIYQDSGLSLPDVEKMLVDLYIGRDAVMENKPIMIRELAEQIVQAVQESDTEFAKKLVECNEHP